MDQKAITILKRIVDCEKISIYDLVQEYAKEREVSDREVFEEVVKFMYLLAGQELVKLDPVEGEDGAETIAKPTPLGITFLRVHARA